VGVLVVLDQDATLTAYEERAGAVDRDALRWRCLACCLTRTVMPPPPRRLFS
jgi:hypothetical protein